MVLWHLLMLGMVVTGGKETRDASWRVGTTFHDAESKSFSNEQRPKTSHDGRGGLSTPTDFQLQNPLLDHPVSAMHQCTTDRMMSTFFFLGK